MATDRQNIRTVSEIRVAESTGSVRIFIVSSETAVCAHAEYKFGQKTAQNDWDDVVLPSSCNAS